MAKTPEGIIKHILGDKHSKNRITNITCPECHKGKLRDVGYYWCPECQKEWSYFEWSRRKG